MKFNLKNRPPAMSPCSEVRQWFEGFEKTIQELLILEEFNHVNATEMNECSERNDILSRSWGRMQLLKAILGDEK